MKVFRPALIALALALSTGFVQAQTAEAPKAAAEYKGRVPKLTRAAVDAYLATPDKVIFIDLRRPDELTAIGGFPVYLSIQSKELEKSLAYIPRDREIITVSNHAGRAANGANLLLDKGFKVVGAVGVQDYEAEGGQLVKLAPPPPKKASASEPAKAH